VARLRPSYLVRQTRDYKERPQNLARLGLAAEGALEDRNGLAGTIDMAEGAIDGETKVAVAARQRRALREIAERNDFHLLKDIGVSQEEALREAEKPFWRR